LRKNKEIRVINNLDFIPEKVVGNISIMLYELMENGSEAYFYSKENIFHIDKKYFEKHLVLDLDDFLISVSK